MSSEFTESIVHVTFDTCMDKELDYRLGKKSCIQDTSEYVPT